VSNTNRSGGIIIIDNHLNHNHEFESEENTLRQVIRNSVNSKSPEELYEHSLKLIDSEHKNKNMDST